MKIKLLLIGLITLLSKGSLFAQSYEQLPPGGKVNGQQAIEALRTNNSFKTVGVSLRDGQLPPDVLARAAENK